MKTLNIGQYEFEVGNSVTNKFLRPIKNQTYPFALQRIDNYLGINLKEFCINNVGYYSNRAYLEARNLEDLRLLCNELSILMYIKENRNLNLHTTIKKILKEYGTIL